MGKNKTTYTIEDMHQIAKEKGWTCLSETYINSATKLKWQCENAHILEIEPAHVKKRGCRYCSKKAKLTIEEMRELASFHGGECLSTEYINLNTQLLWRCIDGHEFWATPDNIKHRKSWCPNCSKYLTEEKCRFILENILKKKFKKTKKPLDNKFELDGFNKSLNLAFEYHGKQHYEFIKFFHGTIEKFNKRVADDEIKKQMCKEKGISLITIPYWNSYTDEDIFQYIVEELKKLNFNTNCTFSNIPFDEFTNNKSYLNNVKEIIEKKGGTLLSKTYNSYSRKIKIRCKEGHVWSPAIYSIQDGRWCPKCAGLAKGTIEEMHELAKIHDGQCLSTEYINSHKKLQWKCKEGHVFQKPPSSIKNGQWCMKCNNRERFTLEMLQQIATNKGGKCLAEILINGNENVEWECEKGHRWFAMPTAVKPRGNRKGTWCIICAEKKKKTIKDLQQIANSKGGKCLSIYYTNKDALYKWECENGHIWEARVRSAEKTWCKTCKPKNINKNLIGIDFFKEYAKQKGGECLTNEYINNKQKLTFKCDKGHVFETTGGSMKRTKSWCKYCYKSRKKKE